MLRAHGRLQPETIAQQFHCPRAIALSYPATIPLSEGDRSYPSRNRENATIPKPQEKLLRNSFLKTPNRNYPSPTAPPNVESARRLQPETIAQQFHCQRAIALTYPAIIPLSEGDRPDPKLRLLGTFNFEIGSNETASTRVLGGSVGNRWPRTWWWLLRWRHHLKFGRESAAFEQHGFATRLIFLAF